MNDETRANAFKSVTDADDKVEAEPDGGLETEADNSNLESEPSLDPAEVRIRTTYVSVEQIVLRIKNGEIYWDTDVQQSFDWKPMQQSHLIESLLLRIPIPVFYLAADEDSNWSVVDGVQRLLAIYNYVTDEFPLNRLEYFNQFNGKHYSDLPRPMQRRIGETELILHIVEAGKSEDVRLNIFRRINTGGLTLNCEKSKSDDRPHLPL